MDAGRQTWLEDLGNCRDQNRDMSMTGQLSRILELEKKTRPDSNEKPPARVFLEPRAEKRRCRSLMPANDFGARLDRPAAMRNPSATRPSSQSGNAVFASQRCSPDGQGRRPRGSVRQRQIPPVSSKNLAISITGRQPALRPQWDGGRENCSRISGRELWTEFEKSAGLELARKAAKRVTEWNNRSGR